VLQLLSQIAGPQVRIDLRIQELGLQIPVRPLRGDGRSGHELRCCGRHKLQQTQGANNGALGRTEAAFLPCSGQQQGRIQSVPPGRIRQDPAIEDRVADLLQVHELPFSGGTVPACGIQLLQSHPGIHDRQAELAFDPEGVRSWGTLAPRKGRRCSHASTSRPVFHNQVTASSPLAGPNDDVGERGGTRCRGDGQITCPYPSRTWLSQP